jgi:hypothetical protein
MYTSAIVLESASVSHANSSAKSLNLSNRKTIALKVLAGGNVTGIANAENVSRKFVHQQVNIAKDAVDDAFAAPTLANEKVLFTVQVTKTLLRRMVLSMLLRCHAPYRGVIAFLEDVFGQSVSIGTIHNIAQDAIDKARTANEAVPLNGVKVGLHDEIYQNGRPVLVGVDAWSSFCYLLAAEGSCDGATWGCHLLDAQGRGLAPVYFVADQGKGLRAGLREVYPDIPCFADVFHILKDFGDVLRLYDNRLSSAIDELEKIKAKRVELKRKGDKQSKLSSAFATAREKQRHLADLVSALKILRDWLRHDILAIAGPRFEVRLELLNFVIDELSNREAQNDKIASLRKRIANAKVEILGFVTALDGAFAKAGAAHDLPVKMLEKIAIMLSCSHSEPMRYEIEAELRASLRGRYHLAVALVEKSFESTPRASSLVESVNSRLRSYFFLRRAVGNGYLALLQFYLNHRVLTRSDRAHRVGKTPREVLTGEKHGHWLDMLGFPAVVSA